MLDARVTIQDHGHIVHVERPAFGYDHHLEFTGGGDNLLALVAAGRISLKRLNRPNDALKFYETANSSKVPHMDWQPNIDNGINDAKAALAKANQLAYR